MKGERLLAVLCLVLAWWGVWWKPCLADGPVPVPGPQITGGPYYDGASVLDRPFGVDMGYEVRVFVFSPWEERASLYNLRREGWQVVERWVSAVSGYVVVTMRRWVYNVRTILPSGGSVLPEPPLLIVPVAPRWWVGSTCAPPSAPAWDPRPRCTVD
ncbi:MAG: hypothetical protein ACUVS5_11875 [Anaerolineae bacterium]